MTETQTGRDHGIDQIVGLDKTGTEFIFIKGNQLLVKKIMTMQLLLPMKIIQALNELAVTKMQQGSIIL